MMMMDDDDLVAHISSTRFNEMIRAIKNDNYGNENWHVSLYSLQMRNPPLNSTCNLYELPLECAHHFLTYSRCATPLTSRMKISTLPSGTSRKSEANRAGADDLMIDFTILEKSESDCKKKT